MTKQTPPTLDDVMKLVPAEHHATMAFLQSQMTAEEGAILAEVLPRLFDAIKAGDYAAFEAGLTGVGYGQYAFIVWSLLDQGE